MVKKKRLYTHGKRSDEINAVIEKNISNGFPLSIEELTRKFEKDGLRPSAVYARELRVAKEKGLPTRDSAQPKGWEPGKGGPEHFSDINDFIKANAALSRDELAEKCGISRTAIRQREQGLGIRRSTNKAKPKQKSIPQEVELFVAEQIRSGALVDEKIGESEILKKVKEQFPRELNKANIKLTKQRFAELVGSLVWTEGKDGTLTALKEIVKHGAPLKRFMKYHSSVIEDKRVEQKAKELRGETKAKKTPAEFLRGINRIGTEKGLEQIEDFEIPTTSFKKPFPVEPRRQKDWRSMVINGTNIGIKHGRVMENNPVRQALSSAERLGCDAVFLTNTLDIDMTKAGGPLKALRALASGREVNTAILDPAYQEKALRILQEMPDDEVVYETANEAFEDLMSAWYNITHLPSKKPYEGRQEFSGKTYVVFGYKEENFVLAATYWTVAHHTNANRNKLEAELKSAKSAFASIAKAHKKGEDHDETLKKDLEEEIDRLSREIARTRITPVSPQEWQRFYPQVLAHVIQRFEEKIPNCKVIGVNTTYIRYGAKSIELNVPDNERVADTHLSNRVKVHATQVLREELSDAVIVCHPWSLNTHVTARERDTHAKRGHAYFASAPMCVDGEFLRKELSHIVRKAHPINKVASSEVFQPGVLLLECVNDILLPPQQTSVGALDKYRLRRKDFANKKTSPWGKRRTPLAAFPDTRYIYYLIATDIHIGSRNRESIWCEERGERLGMLECLFHLMRRDGLFKSSTTPPIHFFSTNDDVVQGNHFETHQQPHVHELSYVQIQDLWNEMMRKAKRARSKSDALKLFSDMRELMLYQLEIRGLDWTQQQVMEVFERLIEPNIDAFDGILRRAEQSKLIVRPISEFEGVPYDSRDIGVLNSGTGNHFTRTLDKKLVEGPLYADKMRTLLQHQDHWLGNIDKLKRMVKAPLDGNRPIGYGTIKVPGGCEWGIDMRDTPTGGIDWHDPMRPTVLKEMGRGNVSRIMEGKPILGTYGDKHFLSFISTPWRTFVMGPPETHTDVFGELGFPPNNTGVVVLGLPVDGPDGGPILLRALLYDDLKRLVEEKRSLDWEKFLPNAA